MNNTATQSKKNSGTDKKMKTPTSPGINLKEKSIIVSYTRKDALADQQQFNVGEIDLTIRRDTGIKIPLFITDTIMNIVEDAAALSSDTIEWILFDI